VARDPGRWYARRLRGESVPPYAATLETRHAAARLRGGVCELHGAMVAGTEGALVVDPSYLGLVSDQHLRTR